MSRTTAPYDRYDFENESTLHIYFKTLETQEPTFLIRGQV